MGPVDHLGVEGGGDTEPVGRTPFGSTFLPHHPTNSSFDLPCTQEEGRILVGLQGEGEESEEKIIWLFWSLDDMKG